MLLKIIKPIFGAKNTIKVSGLLTKFTLTLPDGALAAHQTGPWSSSAGRGEGRHGMCMGLPAA